MKRMKNLKLNLISKYSLLFILASILTFGYFVINGKSFVWHMDGYTQHSVALTYYGTWLRDIVRNILFEHTFSIPMWDFGIGYGGDIITTLNYYVLGEPLNLLSIFVSPQYTEYLYAFLIILRLYLAGLFFVQFCKIMNHKGNGVIAGALVYVFTAYTMWAAVRHPFFILPIMFFPLMLTGVEKIIKGKKPYQFILTIVLCAVSNFYFFYMIAFFTVIYAFVRCGFLYKKDIKKIVAKLGAMLLYAIVAVMISAVIFLPVIIFFLGDSRSEVTHSVPLLYDLKYYQQLLSSFISSDSGGYWNYMGYSPLVIPALFYMFKKKNIQQCTFFGIGFFMMLIPFIGSFMNGFSYISNRWIWAFAMFCAYILVEYWKDVISIDIMKDKILFLVLAIYAVVICFMQNTRTENTLIELLLLIFTVALICYMNQNKKIVLGNLDKVLTVSILLGIAINAFNIYSVSEKNYVAEFIDSGKVYKSYKASQSGDIKKYVKDNSFFRFSATGGEVSYTSNSTLKEQMSTGLLKERGTTNSTLDFCDNAAILFGVNGIGYYWSLGSSAVSDYLLAVGAKEYSTYFYHGIDDRASLLSLSSVKYYICEKGNEEIVPYGFRKYKTITKPVPYSDRNLEVKKSDKKKRKSIYNIYVNDFALPLGYTYDKVISNKELDTCNGTEKEEAMLQAAVVEEDTASETLKDISLSSKELNYKVTCNPGVKYNNNRFVVTEKGAGVFVQFDTIKNKGLYVSIDNLSFKQDNPLSVFKGQLDSFSLAEQNLFENRYKYWKEQNSTGILFDSNGVYKQLAHYNADNPRYNGRGNYVVNLGYSTEERNGIYIYFNQTGTYTFDHLKLVEQSFDTYGQSITHLKENSLANVKVEDNEVTGSIWLDKKKLLCLTIPYSSGWKIYVDGKETDLKKVNYMYSGVFLEQGEHNIRLQYCTPGIKAGMLISGVGIFILLIIVLAGYFYKNKKN